MAGVSFGLVGALVLRTRPDNRLGLVIAVTGLSALLGSAAEEYAQFASWHADLPAGGFADWLAATLWYAARDVLEGAREQTVGQLLAQLASREPRLAGA